ncbi:MAG: shikimate kinase [Bacilli bacterium]
MKSIILVGFMGSGKTTVGVSLAHKLSLQFIDLDRIVEDNEGTSIPEMFSKYGEEYFRDAESRAVQGIQSSGQIVATGGGVIKRPENVEWLLNTGVVVYLRCSFETVLARIEGDSNRPLAKNSNVSELKALYDSRLQSYEKAHIIVDVDHLSVEKIGQAICDSLDNV